MGRVDSPPPGYEAARVGAAEIVARRDAVDGVRDALAAGTLHAYAAGHAAARPLHGRVPAFAAPLPRSGTWVVVRHSHHGGLLAPITRDRFLVPTRAPRELATAGRLAALGVPTPPIIAYVIYPAGWLLRRSDVASLEIGGGADLATIFTGGAHTVGRADAVAAAATLLRSLARAGVRHPDLNLKNILVAPGANGSATAYLLDVDRVGILADRAAAAAANAARLARSARRWRDRHGAPISEADIAALRSAARGGPE
jgi:hypothetical protein